MGIVDLFFDKYTRIHGTKCVLKKNEVLKLCDNGVRLDLNRTRYIIEKIDFDDGFISILKVFWQQREKLNFIC